MVLVKTNPLNSLACLPIPISHHITLKWLKNLIFKGCNFSNVKMFLRPYSTYSYGCIKSNMLINT